MKITIFYQLYLISLFLKNILSVCNVYLINGEIDVTKTLYNCSINMIDNQLIPSIKNNIPVVVTTQLLLNSLISVNEIEGTCTFDFFFKLQWIDSRWLIPDMWQYLDKRIADQGLPIGPLVLNEGDLNLNMWLPDLQFMDQVDSTLVSQSMKFKPKGVISWSRHILLVLTQPQFDYAKYPMDSQNITIRFASPSLANSFLAIQFDSLPVLYINAPYPNQNKYNFPENSIWSHDISDVWTYIFKETQLKKIGTFSYNRTYDHGIVNVRIVRKSDGVLIRLGLPVLMLMILSGFIFWAAMENRIDSTMTILLSVSALYIVVFGNIPLLGYLTTFDRYILAMFLLLTINVVLHQFTFRLSEKTEKWPLRQFFIRLLEFAGRITVIPLALYLFSSMFDSKFVSNLNQIAIIILTVGMTLIFMRESFGVKKAFQDSMIELQYKVDENSIDSLSWYEVLLYYFYYRVLKNISKKICKSSSNNLSKNSDNNLNGSDDNNNNNNENGRGSMFGIELKSKVLEEVHSPTRNRTISIDNQPDSDDDDDIDINENGNDIEIAKSIEPRKSNDFNGKITTNNGHIINGKTHQVILTSNDLSKRKKSRYMSRTRSSSDAKNEPTIIVVTNESPFSL